MSLLGGKKGGLEAAANTCLQQCHWQLGCCAESDRHSGLFCVLKADVASGLAPDFLLKVPAQSILLYASLKKKCGLQEIVPATNLCVHLSHSH